MSKLRGQTTMIREWTGPSCTLNDRPVFTVKELMKRYPDGNIPDMPGKAERRVRQIARRRLAAMGVVYQGSESNAE